MSRTIKTPHKLVGVAVLLAGVYFGLPYLARSGLVKLPGFMAALIPEKIVLPKVEDAKVQNVVPVAQPLAAAAKVDATLIRVGEMAWNAQMGFNYSNGGATTTKGSLQEKYGVNLLIYRQDDTNKMQNELVACATELAGGKTECTTGANAVIIMGDGAPQFLAGLNPLLKKLGPQWQAEIVGAVGYSRGEDSFMAPPTVKADPQRAKGLLVEAVILDGDWNIAVNWAGTNGIKNNPDLKTWDPDAINWVKADDFVTAGNDYIAGKCEDRQEVKNGTPTGKTVNKCVEAICSWTPVDVSVVQKKGGLVKVVSTKEYRSQMPAVLVGPKSFFDTNRKEIAALLAAAFEGGDQVRAFDTSLKKASEVSAAIYADKESPAQYWYKYYKGVTESDQFGNKVSLGGSLAMNLADNLILFGMGQGLNDNFRSTYMTFARVDLQQYSEQFKGTPIPDPKDIEDKSFVMAAKDVITDPGSAPDLPKFAANEGGPVVAKQDIHIHFDTGKATLTSEGVEQLKVLKDQVAITGLNVKVEGHTDNTGDEERTNIPLSKARALAVKQFLQGKYPESFPDDRLREVNGFGSSHPVASNTTARGRAENRRVHIVMYGQ
jgi:outer membrane protein OmpA-like peptidoglycan-associated protein